MSDVTYFVFPKEEYQQIMKCLPDSTVIKSYDQCNGKNEPFLLERDNTSLGIAIYDSFTSGSLKIFLHSSEFSLGHRCHYEIPEDDRNKVINIFHNPNNIQVHSLFFAHGDSCSIIQLFQETLKKLQQNASEEIFLQQTKGIFEKFDPKSRTSIRTMLFEKLEGGSAEGITDTDIENAKNNEV